MPTLHHVYVVVPPELVEAEGRFLVQVLGFRPLAPTVEAAARSRRFVGDDGAQIHIGPGPDHRPAAQAHIAIDLGADRDRAEERLAAAGIAVKEYVIDGERTVHCQDPAGNRWELRDGTAG